MIMLSMELMMSFTCYRLNGYAFISVKVIRRGQSPISVKLVFIQEMFERVKGPKTREPVYVHIIRHVLVATITDIIKTILS